MNDCLEMLFLLIGLHALCDYPLQGDFLAQGKGSFAKPHFGIPWWHCLTAHSLIHGAAVMVCTQSAMMGVIETVLHWLIDYARCRKWTGINADQLMHVLCKVGYVVFLACVTSGGVR